MKLLHTLLLGTALLAPCAAARAACAIQGTGSVSSLSNSFPALDVIAAAMRECGSDTLKVIVKETTDNEPETTQALQSAKSPYGLVQLTNSTITPAQAAGQLLPLNALVAKYKDKYKIEDQMLIRIGGDVMAIAFEVNAQHLFYRKDLFDAAGIAVPKTYDEVLAAAQKLRGASGIEFPLGGTYKAGWNIAEEFVNNYLGMGGEMFRDGTAQPAFANATGVKTLQVMKSLTAYMSPNALALDTAATAQQFQQGQVALANMWASRAANMDDPKQSKTVGKIEFAAAPTIIAGGKPATTLWWDGFSIPKNFDGDPDLAFQVMMEGLKESVVEANNDTAIWLRSVYKPTRYATGAMASAKEGAPIYPMTPQQSLAHNALGAHVGDFLAGKATAEKALADAADAYTAAAKAKGLLN